MGRTNILIIILYLSITSCVKDKDFEAPESLCINNIEVNTTIAHVKDLYKDEVIQIQEDLILEGYIISSDKEGNFFGSLHIQNVPANPTEGIQIEIDVRDSHLFYQVGSKVYVKLKGLYLGKSKGVFKIGGVFSAFGNISVGRLPSAIVQQHIFLGCDVPIKIQPTIIGINTLEDNLVNTLVEIEGLEIIEAELGLPFAIPTEETERILKDCNGNEITLLNSGYSNFKTEIIPEGNGTITAVLLKENDDFKLVIRDVKDIIFNGERCPPDEVTSNQIFISELADPNNNLGARFIELFNSSDSGINLKGWKLVRYTNAGAVPSSFIDLSNHKIRAKRTFVISSNASEFNSVYGFAPDMEVGTNSPADSNGDDNIVLEDPFGVVIDIFGVIGEDGSNTNHEFQDGRAVRNSNIRQANSIYTFSEWTIFNDRGEAETIKNPQNAPEDFTPGSID